MEEFFKLLRANKFSVIYDIEYNNEWSDIELCSHITFLNCIGYELTEIPNLPHVRILSCARNLLTVIPDLPEVQLLFCTDNKLTELPNLPKLLNIDCINNNLFSYNLEDWKVYWGTNSYIKNR